MTATEFDVVIPCFEPKSDWADHLVSAMSELGAFHPNFQLGSLIVVNDGSSNDLSAAIRSLQNSALNVEIIQHATNLGKGAAIRTGLKKCASPIVLFTDVDVPYRKEDMAKMVAVIGNDEADLAVGIRGKSYYESLSTFRRLVSKGLLQLNRTLFRLPVGDTQGGLKVMNGRGKEAVLKTTIDRYLFDLEAVKIATKQNLRIKGIEVQLQKGIQLPGLGFNILLQEFGNLITLLFKP